MRIRVFAFRFHLEPVDATIVCPHCKDTIMPAHAATACPIKFMDDVVFATIRMKEHFRVAHELLLCYMREIDSIGTYVWALRWKMKLAHQADPVLGVMHWQDFMRSVRVKSHVDRLLTSGPRASATISG